MCSGQVQPDETKVELSTDPKFCTTHPMNLTKIQVSHTHRQRKCPHASLRNLFCLYLFFNYT